MKRIENYLVLPTLLAMLGVFTCSAQTAPIFSHYYANPYQFNPAFAASNGYTEANILYRKQWMNINNAPTTLAFNLQTPVGRNVSLALNVISDQTILLNTNYLMTTFGYRIRFSREHHLNFGLSGGVGFNNYDFEAINEVGDPTLTFENNTFLSGQFGFYYQYKNLTLGLALPKLFDSRPPNGESFSEIEFNEFKNKFGSVGYTFAVGENVRISPIVIYRSHDDREDQWEGMLMASYKNIFWVGSSYRHDYGLTGFIGFNLKSLFRVGYAYEYPTGDIANVSGGTHEIYMGGRLGKKNREDLIASETPKEKEPEPEPEVAAAPEEEPVVEQAEPVAPVVETAPVVVAAPVEQPRETTPAVQPQPEPEETVSTPTEEETNQTGFYLVVGVFKSVDNALKQMGYLKNDGLNPALMYRSEKDYYYIYVYYSATRQNTVDEWKRLRQRNKYYGAWVLTIGPE